MPDGLPTRRRPHRDLNGSTAVHKQPLDAIFPGSSEMARRMRELDWSQTALGPVDRWPHALRTSVSTCLNCAFPIVLWWGPDLTILYNDEYSQALGPEKHPAALGQPGSTVWAEIWDVIEPMLMQVYTRGEATRSRDLMLHIDRGYVEEAYFSFSYSPIYEEHGKIGGVFCPVIETTEKVTGERRLRTLRDLAAKCKGAESEEATFDAAASILAANPQDVPFAMIYRIDERRSSAQLKAVAGIERGTGASPETVVFDGDGGALWSLGAVARSGRIDVVTDIDEQFSTLPTGAWKRPPRSAKVLPIMLPGQQQPRAILVAAISPMRALDDDYRTFFRLIAAQIAAGLADAEAREQERRRAEALAEIDRAKTAFFSNVSHEFRTPLTLMLGPLEDLLGAADPALPRGAAETLKLAHRNGLRLLKLVNTLLDFSRIEAGRMDASYERTDLAAYTAELASVFRSAIEKAGLRLVVECDPLPDAVYVDRNLWEKIVLNLLSNAFKFTFEGTITIALRWQHDRVQLSVSDTGVGIPESDVPLMFQRFHRVKHARSRTHEGTGIGLALVQELARLHGGHVSVASREGAGSTFTVTIRTGTGHLPSDRIAVRREAPPASVGSNSFVDEALRWLPDDEQRPERSEHTVIEIPQSSPMAVGTVSHARILLADDNADMREYLRRLLGHTFDVETVADGQTALERIAANPPDLVVADVMMPNVDGFGLLAAIRSDERHRSLPVMLLSARAGEEARIEGLRAGADDYVVKPFSGRELVARVSSQLALARLRRDAEQALRYRIQQHETLLNQAPLGVYLVDADFRIQEVNPVARQTFGGVSDDLIGKDFGDVMHRLWRQEYAEEIVRTFRSTLETGVPYFTPERTEFRIDRGRIEYYEWRIDRITLPDGRFGVVCYFRDVSEQVNARRKLAESELRLREADARKDQFLAQLAHELRNPLAPIRTGLELIRLAGDSKDAVARTRNLMERQVSHMVRLIDDLLDISRITAGKIALEPVPTLLNGLVQGAIDAQRVAIEANHIDLILELPPRPCVIDVDPTRFVQVLSNVVHNALKFTPSYGRVRVTAETRSIGTTPDAELAITVTDTGMGISKDMLPHVFDLFAQGEHSSGGGYGGMGIGLALARKLIELQGGSIEAQSDGPGKGSTFVIRLPLSLESAAPTPPRSDVHSINCRAVIIDDNRDAAETMSMVIEQLGGTARTADNAIAGMKAISEFHPDVVLLDISMPGIDGYETCRLIRNEADRNMVIVALTGWGQEHDKQRALEAGFDAHLTKPVDIAAFEELLAGASSAS
jgi:PAS domain S-box-containing protein